MTAKTVVTLGPWANPGDFSRAALTIGTLPVYRVKINAKSHRPGNPVAIESYVPGHKYPWTGNRNVSIALAAEMLAEMGTDLCDLESFFQKVAEMGWGDDLVREARRAANALVGAPESPAYLVIRLLSGVLEYEYLPTMAEAQQAVADHCGVETTDLQSSAGIPWGAVFSATNGDKYDAWAFPVHDSGENIADLSTRLEVVSQHRWQLWEAFHTAAARLRVHGLEVPEPLSDTEDEPVADKSVLRRLAVQIPEEMQPAFLATTFDLAVLRAALAIAEQNKEEEEES